MREEIYLVHFVCGGFVRQTLEFGDMLYAITEYYEQEFDLTPFGRENLGIRLNQHYKMEGLSTFYYEYPRTKAVITISRLQWFTRLELSESLFSKVLMN